MIKIKKRKYIYYFRGDLSSHVGLYKSWVDASKDEINISIMTIIDKSTYLCQKNLVKKYRNLGVEIFVVPNKCKTIFAFLYFFSQILKNGKVIVHLRKQSPDLLKRLRSIFKGRISYVIDIEGDFLSEIDYLTQDEKSYKPKFYDSVINSMKVSSDALEYDIYDADGCFVATDTMKELFIDRYREQNLRSKLTTLPTASDSNNFFYDSSLREKYRKKLSVEDRFVIVFSGNAYYSWQNVKHTLKLFKLLKEKGSFSSPLMLLLIREKDIYIVQEFIDELSIDINDYILTTVPHEEVNAMLNAADLGILLREQHLLNKVVTTGKLGEYLCAGLNTLTTKHIGYYSELLESENIGLLIDDIYNNIETVDRLERFEMQSREHICNWAKNNLSVSKHKDTYINAMKKI